MLTEFGYETYVFEFRSTNETPLYYRKKIFFNFRNFNLVVMKI
jgi:hypothetical protein